MMLTDIPVNYLAVVVAAVAYMAIGMIWFMPMVFGNTWMKLAKTNMNGSAKDMMTPMIISAITGLVTAYVMAAFAVYMDAEGWMTGAMLGFWLWLGFNGLHVLVHNSYEGRPFQLTLITAGYNLVAFLVMGAVVATWR